MKEYWSMVMETVAFLREHLTTVPKVGVLTGTGLSGSMDSLLEDLSLDYSKIPNFPVSTVESHRGRLVSGTLAGRGILAMQGRFHLYEGYSPLEVAFPVRVMQGLGMTCLVVTNAAGGINLDFSRGDIMVIRDHINFTGANPLAGPNNEAWGDRFPDMAHAWDSGLVASATDAAQRSGFTVRTGIYAGLSGPSLETPAEIRFLKLAGCDAVGFSTVMENIAGVHAGMKVLGLSVITNINNPDAPEKISVEAVIETAEKAAPKLDAILRGVVQRLI
ncbi:MAG: purine-nucleoside phosphorylase [Desulfobacteraceae bacterium]|nr:purine-nucleoside phosphorylase [Desulfobacteraceae bacterium]